MSRLMSTCSRATYTPTAPAPKVGTPLPSGRTRALSSLSRMAWRASSRRACSARVLPPTLPSKSMVLALARKSELSVLADWSVSIFDCAKFYFRLNAMNPGPLRCALCQSTRRRGIRFHPQRFEGCRHQGNGCRPRHRHEHYGTCFNAGAILFSYRILL